MNETEYIDRAAAAWAEFKQPHWREYTPRSSRATDQRRLFAIAYASDWPGGIKQRMERLLTLLPRAIEQAARLTAFGSARTTLWSILRSADGIERLAGGIVPGESGPGWDSGVYDEQIIRLRLEEDTIAYIRAQSEVEGLSCSALTARIIEQWLEQQPPIG
jgi:hypothetical protein